MLMPKKAHSFTKATLSLESDYPSLKQDWKVWL